MNRPTTVAEAVRYLTRHTDGAPWPHFGDTRERSAYLAGRVGRLTTEDLEYGLLLAGVLGERWHRSLTRGQRQDVYDVAAAMRRALCARR
ncbi:hypothetical protein [Streptomyces sp. NPDC001889]